VTAGGVLAFALPLPATAQGKKLGGMGYLMITSLATLNATDMFTSVVVLSAVGVALVTLIRREERRPLRWAPEFRT